MKDVSYCFVINADPDQIVISNARQFQTTPSNPIVSSPSSPYFASSLNILRDYIMQIFWMRNYIEKIR